MDEIYTKGTLTMTAKSEYNTQLTAHSSQLTAHSSQLTAIPALQTLR